MKKLFSLVVLFIACSGHAYAAQAAFPYDPAASGSGSKAAKDNLKFPSGLGVTFEAGSVLTLPDGFVAWAKLNKGGSSLADLTTRSATDLSSGTLPDARFPATLPALNGSLLTALNASALASGTLPDARFPSTLPALNGSALTNLNAGAITSGTLLVARGGTGAASFTANAIVTGNGTSAQQSAGAFAFSANTVAAVGDSLTVNGYYQLYLEPLMGSTWFIENHGVSGNTTSAMLARFAGQVTSRGDVNYVIIWGGINDIAGGVDAATIQTNLQAMFTAAQAVGIKVISINVTPFKTSADWTAPRQVVADAVNAWLASGATGIDYKIDAYSLLEDPSNPDALLPAYSSDGLHLTLAGHSAVATLINAQVGTWTATKTIDPRIRLGAERANSIFRAGAAHLGTDAQFTVFDIADATALGVAALVSRGGLSVQKSAIIAGTATAGAVSTPSLTLSATAGNTTLTSLGTGVLGLSAVTPRFRAYASDVTIPFGFEFYNSGTYEASLRHQSNTAVMTLDVGRNSSWGGKFDIYADTSLVVRFAKTSAVFSAAATFTSAVTDFSSGTPDIRFSASSTGTPHGVTFYGSGSYDASIKHTPATGLMTFDNGRNSSWGAVTQFKVDTTETFRMTKTLATFSIPITGTTVGTSGNATIGGTITAGSGSTTITDAAGKVLSAALNTVGVAQGGTGAVTLTGLVKGNGTSAFTAAVSGTDYAPATSGSSLLYGNGAGGFSNATVGSNLSFSAGTLNLSATPTGLTSIGVNTVASAAASDLSFTSGSAQFRFVDALPDVRLVSSTTTSPYGLKFYSGGSLDAALTHQANTAEWIFDNGRNSSWGGKTIFKVDTTEVLRFTKTAGTFSVPISTTGTIATAGGSAFSVTAVNSVSPTSPNRTITFTYGGTTYYIAAKTTND